MRSKIMMAIFILLVLAGCIHRTNENVVQPTNTPPSTTVTAVAASQIPTMPPTKTGTSQPNLGGPTLLIQTGTNKYQLIDFGTDTTHNYSLPDSNIENRLAGNLSPSKSKLIFHINQEKISIVELASGKVHSIDQFQSSDDHFNPEKALQEALNTNPHLATTDETLLASINEAFKHSKRNVRWYQSDQSFLSVFVGSQTSSNLYLQDLQTGNRIQLEDSAGLIEAFWIGPNPELILVKKGYVFEPGVWKDDRYFLVDVSAGTTRPLPLPKDINNPAVFWITATKLGVIHQIQPMGGIGYSVIDVNEMEVTVLTSELFTQVVPFENNFLMLQPGANLYSTVVQIREVDGLIRRQKELGENCRLSKIIEGHIIMNCEHESLVMDEQLTDQHFSDPIYSITPSPNGESIILVTRPGEVRILHGIFGKSQPIELVSAPLEVRWLPDATGFLYRTLGKLYMYDIAAAESRLLIESDSFADYTNINAAWIKVP